MIENCPVLMESFGVGQQPGIFFTMKYISGKKSGINTIIALAKRRSLKWNRCHLISKIMTFYNRHAIDSDKFIGY
jgi:hypothetical protein